MTATKALGTYGDAVGVVTPIDHKMAQSGLIVKTSGNAVRTGLFWGGTTTIITGKANMSYDVAAFTAALSRGATAGTVLLSNDGTLNVATTAAPGSNSRIDIIYVWAREYSLDGVDSNPVIGVVQGTTAAVPSAPSLSAYPGAIELGRATVGAGITATTSATITQTAPFTCSAGGVIAFRTSTERDLGTYQEGQLGWLLDTDTLQIYNGSSWSSTRRSPTFRVVDQKAVNTAGGTFTAGAWQKRDLNTTQIAEISGASVTSSVITLPAGTYHVRASAPAFAVNANLLRLRQTSGTAATLVVGTAVAADSTVSQGVTSIATLEGEFTLTASQTLELQHYCATTRATNGLGLATNWGEANIFAEIQFEKVA